MANIDTTVELNKLLKEQNKLLQAQAKIMKSQAATMKAMVTSMRNMPVEDVNRSFQEMNNAIKDADAALEDFASDQQQAFSDVASGAEEAEEGIKSMTDRLIDAGKKSVVIGVLVQAFTGLNAGVRAGLGFFKSLISVATTLMSTFWNLTTSIIAIPFKMLTALMNEAAQGGDSGLRQAIEDLRKEMGQLSTNEGRAIMKTFRTMGKQGTDTGLSLWRTFGTFAERLQEMTRIATAMGRQFSNMTDEFRTHGRQIGEYVKGLGLSEEAIKAVTQNAAAAGKSFTGLSREITTMAYGMGEAFGINGKLISKDIADMMSQFDDFGSIGVKTMSQIAIFTRKLGIEVKDLLGVIGQFDDFEQAAQSAAQLSQAFGIQVDTLEMLKEQDPAARFETMRKAFLATGRSVEDLTRQELKLLNAHTGISTEALKVGFSQAKAGLSYEEIQKQAGLTEKKQLSQAEAMDKLSDSIELMVKSGQQMKGGFFDIFLQGFALGARRSGDFRKMIWSLRRAMRATLHTGRRVGRMFVQNFPGVKDILQGLTEAFQNFGRVTRRRGITKFLGEIIKDFRKFFTAMTSDPKVALENLFKNMSKSFHDKFDKDTAPGKRVLMGFRTFFVTMGKLFSVGVQLAMKGLTDGLGMLTKFIRDPSSFLKGASTAQSGIAKFFAEVFGPAWKAIEALWPDLQVAFVRLWQQLKASFGHHVIKFRDDAIDFLKGAAVSAAITRLLIATLSVGIAKAGEVIAKKGSVVLGKGLSKMMGNVADVPAFKSGSKNLETALTGAGTAGGAMQTQGALFGKVNWKGLAKSLVVGIAAIALVAAVMAAEFLLISFAFQGAGVKESDVDLVVKAMFGMGKLYLISAGVILASIAVGAVMAIPGVQVAALVGIAAIAAVTAGMAVHTMSIIKSIGKMSLSGNIERKVAVFTNVTKAMASMAQVLVSMMDVATPAFSGLIQLFRGTNPMEDGLKAIKSMMTSMSTHMKDIIVLISTITAGATPEQIKAGEMIGTLLQALTGLMQALQPPEQGLYDKYLEAVGAVDSQLSVMGAYVSKVIGIMKKDVIPAVISAIEVVGKMPAIDPGKIQAFSTFLSGVTTLMKALTPDPALFESMKTSAKSTALWGLVKTEIDVAGDPSQNMKPVMKFMKDMMKNMVGPGGALESIQNFMGGMVKATKKLGDPAQVRTASELFATTMEAISTISQMFTPEKMAAFKDAGGGGTVGVMLSRFNTGIMMPLQQDMPKMIAGFQAIGKNVGKVKASFITKVATGVKDMVSEINAVTESLNGFSANVPMIKTQLAKVGDSLGLAGSEEFKIKIQDINLTINVGVELEAEKFEKALIGRPTGSKFAQK